MGSEKEKGRRVVACEAGDASCGGATVEAGIKGSRWGGGQDSWSLGTLGMMGVCAWRYRWSASDPCPAADRLLPRLPTCPPAHLPTRVQASGIR